MTTSSKATDVRYSDSAGERGVGDLFLPNVSETNSPVLLIHGGGWNAMAKESIAAVGHVILGFGRAVFSINYRLLSHAPWPACSDDCVEAARFMLAGGLESYGLKQPEQVLICGASAGGHLAMMTGLRLPPGSVEAIISIAGPSRLSAVSDTNDPALRSAEFLRQFFGSAHPSEEMLRCASPSQLVRPDAPPLYCVHSRNDELVVPAHSEEAVSAWRKAGVRAEVKTFEGLDKQHGLWEGLDLATRKLVPAAADSLREIMQKLK